MHQPFCVCESATCQGDSGPYYVTVRDGSRTGFLLGPYTLHADAIANVNRGNTLACNADSRAHWYAFGTAHVRHNVAQPKTVFGV